MKIKFEKKKNYIFKFLTSGPGSVSAVGKIRKITSVVSQIEEIIEGAEPQARGFSFVARDVLVTLRMREDTQTWTRVAGRNTQIDVT